MPQMDYAPQVAAGTSNADGSVVTVLSALAHDCEYLVLGFNGFGESGKAMRVLGDVLIDPAGGTSWTQLIADLLIGHTGYGLNVRDSSTLPVIPPFYHFPLWIPAGSTIGVRARTSSATTLGGGGTNGGLVYVFAGGGNKNPGSWWCGQKVETIGVTPASSQGTPVTPGGNSTFGSWTDIGSPTTARGGAVQFQARGTSGTSFNNQLCRYEFGIAGTKIGPPHVGGGSGSNLTLTTLWAGPLFLDVPSGTQFQARGQSSHSTGNALDCAVYVVQ